MTSITCGFGPCSQSSVDRNAEFAVGRPQGAPCEINLYADSDIGFKVNSPLACRRKSMDDILAGLTPHPRQLSRSLCRLNTEEYDLAISNAWGIGNHGLQEAVQKKNEQRQCIVDIQGRILQWLKGS
eukprot:gnl/MRDRNA2_/MRDRNA2_35557_c0_seq1.p1 gnl/MRDRNA2_/MRDRNA2_35557_c0~~gnl/MRDRNA2_/MRDRNA2_35557_c0_seq1.p1  ORF type:complete len:127 (-),score=19.01 gnl/MRDRNA2_/MRDRNA2_35557_c0_seq1:141-521(-)